MAVHMLQGKDIRVMIADEHGYSVNFGPMVPDVEYPAFSFIEFGPAYFEVTWSDPLLPSLDKLATAMLEKQIPLKKHSDTDDRPPPNNRKEKRRQAAIARKGRKDG